MTTDIAVLDHLVVVNLDIHIWTARKKLVPLDLGGAELPPEGPGLARQQAHLQSRRPAQFRHSQSSRCEPVGRQRDTLPQRMGCAGYAPAGDYAGTCRNP